MNSTEYRKARHTEFRIAMDAYCAVVRNNDATAEEFTAAANARTWAAREWVNAQRIANTMAQAEIDAAAAKGCEEVVAISQARAAKPITAMTPAEQVAISQDRAAIENAQWGQINAAAIVAMNAHAPSADLTALRKYLAE